MGHTTRLFFSHATEDKGRVLQVYGRLIEAYPDLDPWIDTFEITGGQALLDKIAEGMDQAARFFVFLSPVSVGKPWVQAELRRALTQELGGQRPGYVVPVKMGGLSAVPPFMEHKKYIDLDRLTQAEWMAELRAAATGTKLPSGVTTVENLLVDTVADPAEPHIVQLAIRAQHWADEIGFIVETSRVAQTVSHVWAAGGRGGAASYSKFIRPTEVGYALRDERLTPGSDFRLTIVFEPGVDGRQAIVGMRTWDGKGGSESGVLFLR